MLKGFSQKLCKAKTLRKGPILFRFTGPEGGDFFLDCSSREAKLAGGTPTEHPLIELIGDARRIGAVLEGKKDARTQFLAGGFRIRGDLRYVGELAMELGIIKTRF